jgi:hypothetical protein
MHFWPAWSYLNGIRIDYLSPTVYLTDCLILAAFLLSVFRFKFLKTVWIFAKSAFIRLIILLLLLNLYFSQSVPNSLVYLLRWSEIVFTVIFVSQCLKADVNAEKKLLVTLSISVGVTALVGLAQFHLNKSVDGLFYWLGERRFSASTPGIALARFPGLGQSIRLRPYSIFSHPNSLAGFLVVGVFLLNELQVRYKQLVIIISSIVVLLTLSLPSIASMFLFPLANQKKPIRKVAQIGTVLIILFVLSVSKEPQSILQRKNHFVMALEIVNQNPIWGVGPGNYIRASHEMKSSSSLFKGAQDSRQPVHNVPLLLLAELGIPLSALLLLALYKANKKIKKLSLVLGISLAAIIFTSMFDHYWITLQQNRLLLAVVLGMIWSKGS